MRRVQGCSWSECPVLLHLVIGISCRCRLMWNSQQLSLLFCKYPRTLNKTVEFVLIIIIGGARHVIKTRRHKTETYGFHWETRLSHATPIMKLSSVVYRTIKWLKMIFMPIRPTLSLLKAKFDGRLFPIVRKPLKAVDIMSLSTHDRSGLSHDIVLPGTVDNSVLSIISVLSFRGIHDGIYNLRFFCMCTSLLQGWMSMTLHSPVRNGWALPAADECSFLTRMYSVGRQS